MPRPADFIRDAGRRREPDCYCTSKAPRQRDGQRSAGLWTDHAADALSSSAGLSRYALSAKPQMTCNSSTGM